MTIMFMAILLEMGIEPNPNWTNRTRTHIFGRTEPN